MSSFFNADSFADVNTMDLPRNELIDWYISLTTELLPQQCEDIFNQTVKDSAELEELASFAKCLKQHTTSLLRPIEIFSKPQ